MITLKRSEMRKPPLNKRPTASSTQEKKEERSEIRRNVTTETELVHKEEEQDPEEVEENPFSDARAVDEMRIDPATVFPYSNRPKGSRLTVMREESEQWDLFFDPQYTFGSFTHCVSKPNSSDYYYKGKWPLDYEDIIGMAPKHLKNSLGARHVCEAGSIMSAVEEDVFLFPTVPNPTLPDLKHLRSITNIDDNEESDNDDDALGKHQGSMVQVDIIPCPSVPLHAKNTEAEAMWKDRLDLLNTIQHTGFSEELDGTRNAPFQGSRAARIQRQIKDKAEKIKKEALSDRKKNESKEDVLYEDIRELKESASIASFRDFQEKAIDLDMEKSQEGKQKNRQSFLLFVLGFLCPPLWLLNFVLGLRSSENETEASKEIDKKWRKYSRNAFCIALLLFAAVSIIIIVAKPGSVGFRQTKEDYVREDIVMFDDESFVLDG
ncbi:hypothetical protein G6F43_009209 [Rhizopus delemar]|nr:hypothetical protein G6F43_009209 [Rhizopus delemar]